MKQWFLIFFSLIVPGFSFCLEEENQLLEELNQNVIMVFQEDPFGGLPDILLFPMRPEYSQGFSMRQLFNNNDRETSSDDSLKRVEIFHNSDSLREIGFDDQIDLPDLFTNSKEYSFFIKSSDEDEQSLAEAG